MTAPVLVDPAKLYLLALFFINIHTAQATMLFKNLQFSKVTTQRLSMSYKKFVINWLYGFENDL